MTIIYSDTFENLQTLVTTHTSSQATSNNANTFITVSGSEITYTPASGSDKVVYEISFYGEKAGITYLCCQLQHYVSGSWSEIDAKYKKNLGNSGSSSQSYRYYIVWRFVLPAWTGSRQLRLVIGSNKTNRNINLHKLTNWDGSSSVTDQFCNTNLLVYSI